MKKIILSVLVCVLGTAIMLGGTAFAVFMHNFNTVSFDEYTTEATYVVPYDMSAEEEAQLRAAKRIKYPSFGNARAHNFAPELTECYDEIDDACRDYCCLIAHKYDNNADLDFTVENTGTRLTIKFTGTGYPENGAPEELSRTYIFDLEGAGADKLPKLLNRAEIIGY